MRKNSWNVYIRYEWLGYEYKGEQHTQKYLYAGTKEQAFTKALAKFSEDFGNKVGIIKMWSTHSHKNY